MAQWKEFNPVANKSMKDDFEDSPSPFTEKIIAYLNKGELTLASPSSATDVFSGERINQTNCILTDGEYSWSNSLVYYIKSIIFEFQKNLKIKY